MTSAIFYFRHSNRRGVRGLHSIWQKRQFVGYVRVELFDGDVEEAMAAARPKPGESLMNTHEIAQKKRRPR